jgi:hypothetical protein
MWRDIAMRFPGAQYSNFAYTQSIDVSFLIMSTRRSVFPKKQSRRVAAWIYTVMNPIIDSLQRELGLLDRENLTWRSSTGRCEFIRTVQEYVDSTQWPNYYDFVADHSIFEAGFKQHDSSLEKLNGLAMQLYDWMLTWGDFSAALDISFIKYESQKGSSPTSGPDIIDFRNEIPKHAAEYLINNVHDLPSHYTFSGFWKIASGSLMDFRLHPRFQPLRKTTNNLALNSSRLKQALESRRLSLSREFDVPAAPVPGISFDE